MKIDRLAPSDGRHDPSEPRLGAHRVERGVAKCGQELGRPLGDRHLELVQRALVVAQGCVEDGQAVGEGVAARTIELRGYIPGEIIVPDNGALDRRIETEPAINDDVVKQQAKYDSFYTDSERELKRKARETRS